MTTEEHLNKIIAKCREIIALGEKRTKGKWGIERTCTTNWIGPMRQCGDGKIHTIVVDTDREGLKEESLAINDANAAFIAACAGPAEAMAKSTIAAIEGLQRFDDAGSVTWMWAQQSLSKILASWPEEALGLSGGFA